MANKKFPSFTDRRSGKTVCIKAGEKVYEKEKNSIIFIGLASCLYAG